MRKSPIRHRVRQHFRNGHSVKSFFRGKGNRILSYKFTMNKHKLPTPSDFYEAYKVCATEGYYANVYGKQSGREHHIVVLMDLYNVLRKKFPKLKVKDFHNLLTDADKHHSDWNGYGLFLTRGTLTGAMYEHKSFQKFIHPDGFKFFQMWRVTTKKEE